MATTTETTASAGPPPGPGHFFSVPLEAFRQLVETGSLPAEVTCTQCGFARGERPH